MMAASSLSHSANLFSLNNVTASLVRSPKSMVEIVDDMVGSVLIRGEGTAVLAEKR
jgi:hypothetical protein